LQRLLDDFRMCLDEVLDNRLDRLLLPEIGFSGVSAPGGQTTPKDTGKSQRDWDPRHDVFFAVRCAV
jgi:hypothetical protein